MWPCDGRVITIHGKQPASTPLESVTHCLTGIAAETDARLMALDQCQGLAFTLERRP